MTSSPLTPDPTRAPGPIRGIGFAGAFRRFWRLGFTFSGRASRSEYWWAWCANGLVVVGFWVLATVTSFVRGLTWVSLILSVAVLLYAIASAIPGLAVAVRRLHDNNRSGAMLLLEVIPFGGIVVLVFLLSDSDPAGARYDRSPFPAAPTDGTRMPPPAPPAVLPASLAVPPPPVAPVSAPVPIPVAGSSAVPAPPALPPLPPLPPIPTLAPMPTLAPTPALAPTPTAAASPITTEPAAAESDDLDSTRMSAPLVSAEWIVELPDGRVLPLTSTVLLGRSPSNDGHAANAALVPIVDPAKSMSKTHARLTSDATHSYVTDLHSTNGTTVIVDGVTTALTPGVAWPLATDATVMLGSYRIQIRERRG